MFKKLQQAQVETAWKQIIMKQKRKEVVQAPLEQKVS